MNYKSYIEPRGYLTVCATDVQSKKVWTCFEHKNTVLTIGKNAICKSLAGEFSDTFDLYVYYMNFGIGGQEPDGTPKAVSPSLTELFGTVVAQKPVAATIPYASPHTVTFTSVLGSADANGNVINEAGLVLKDDSYFSLLTFGGLTKTSRIELSFSWQLVIL